MLTKIGRRRGLLNFRVFAALAATAAAVALMTCLALSTKPAEAAPCFNCGGGGGATLPCGNYLTSSTPSTPPNDNFLAAKSLPWLQDREECGDNSLATIESYESTPTCAPPRGSISRSVWYTITPNYTSTVTFSAQNLSYPTKGFVRVLALYKGDSLTSLVQNKIRSLQQVGCSFADALASMTPITTQVQAGQTYYLQLSGAPWDPAGDFELHADWGPCYYSSSGLRLCPVS
jgi:hypothetical protein